MNGTNRTVTAGQIARMPDKDLALAVIESRKAVLPDCLNDVTDSTQNFVYYLGLNSKPLVLDRKRFDEFMRDNNIPGNQIMSRVIWDDGQHTAHEHIETLKYSEYNYIGGKHGGQRIGAGIYFEMNGGSVPKHFMGKNKPATLINAVYNPETVKPIDIQTLLMVAECLKERKPAFVEAVGPSVVGLLGKSNISFYALAIGCNVITQCYGPDLFIENAKEHGDICFIDRGALVILDEERKVIA